jgi:hypothetical protein
MAVADKLMDVPTAVSEGLADTPETDAQLYVCPLTLAEPASEIGPLHCISTVTLVVERATTENVAEPRQVMPPSLDAPVIEMV